MNKQTQVTEKRSEVICRNAVKKNQQQSNECTKRCYRDGINKLEISVGAVVTVQVDVSDAIHP